MQLGSVPVRAAPHVERRYLLVPGLRSSRIYVFDVKPDPRKPKLVHTIEPMDLGSFGAAGSTWT
ncbi:MAG TPA: selenium-binding protein SBP56-related protein [Candidatus Micrarchaeaceae archaeon]|nr:selenium-binding protein SBP56-related protein [Candidatus Micrarchaeaceae archaeon]